VLSSHLTFTFVPPLDPIWAGLRLIPLAILASSNGMSWLWAVSWDGPWLGVTYVRAIAGQF
jgi:hypothetical protein